MEDKKYRIKHVTINPFVKRTEKKLPLINVLTYKNTIRNTILLSKPRETEPNTVNARGINRG